MKRVPYGRVVEIYTCDDAGLPMLQQQSVVATVGVGLEGDRYALGKGTFSKERVTTRHISLLALEAFEEANEEALEAFTAAETRRNIITEGVDLNELVDEPFCIGNVLVRGVELCTPCKRPSLLAGKLRFEEYFANRGGLRVEVLTSGMICVGQEIIIPKSPHVD